MEKFRLTKDGKVLYEDKAFKHMNHHNNYIAKKEREGYYVQSMEDYNAMYEDGSAYAVEMDQCNTNTIYKSITQL